MRRFGSVQALRGADFTLMPGELHALLGENGAGKSTLMHVAYGILQPDAGVIRRDGRVVRFPSPLAARAAGLGMVHQHSTAIPALTVAENVALAAGWPVAPRALHARVMALADRLGLPLAPEAPAGDLSVARKQRLEIVKALAGDATVLLLDEPTAVLAPREAAALLEMVRAFCARGGSAVLITHKLAEALAHADRVTVLRAGRVMLTGAAGELGEGEVAGAMIGKGGKDGKDGRDGRDGNGVGGGGELVRAVGVDVGWEDGRGGAVRGASLSIRAGEIVAVAGIEGNGQRELLRAVAGQLPVRAGQLVVARPTAFVPEDRTTEGLIPEFTLTENVALGVGRAAPWVRGARVLWDVARARTRELIAAFDVRAAGPDAPARSLSGGNQQKIVLARAFERRPAVLVAENPTRGLDFDATAAVHARLRDAARGGAAVLVHSTDLDEVMALGDRIVVVANGVLTEAPPGADRLAIGDLMLGLGA